MANTDRIECDELCVESNDVARLRQFVLIEWNERDGFTTRSNERRVNEQHLRRDNVAH